MIPLLRDLVRPYRASLFFILSAMLVQTAMSLAAPWPLKVILDNGFHRRSFELGAIEFGIHSPES